MSKIEDSISELEEWLKSLPKVWYGNKTIQNAIDALKSAAPLSILIREVLPAGAPNDGLSTNQWIDFQAIEVNKAVWPPLRSMTDDDVIKLREVIADIARGAVCRVILDKVALIQNLVNECHGAAVARGWYTNALTGERKERNVGELLALMHSEISEGLEAHRKTLPSEHLPGFTGEEEEMADLLIRLMDYAGYRRLRLGLAYTAKRAFNDVRPDHALEVRQQAGGKAY